MEGTKQLFELGMMVITPGAQEALDKSHQSAAFFLVRHGTGDWGIMPEDDKEQNELALKDGSRIFSAYLTLKNEKIWVITEADRSITTILLPSEY